MLYTLLRYLHLIAILVLAGALIIENMAVKPAINGEDARNLAKVDGVYGLSAVLVFLFGLTLWLWVGKPSEFYSVNPLFHAKLGLFVGIALLSIFPTLFFLKHRNSPEDESLEIEVPKSVRVILKLELIVLFFLPVLAYLMARGIGLPA